MGNKMFEEIKEFLQKRYGGNVFYKIDGELENKTGRQNIGVTYIADMEYLLLVNFEVFKEKYNDTEYKILEIRHKLYRINVSYKPEISNYTNNFIGEVEKQLAQYIGTRL